MTAALPAPRPRTALLLAAASALACAAPSTTPTPANDTGGDADFTTRALPASPQRTGDADAGWEVLRYGDFVGAGLPAELWFDLIGPTGSNQLQRTGRSAALNRAFNLFDAPNGVEVVGGLTCMGCHGSWLNGNFIPGLGDAFSDFTGDQSGEYDALRGIIAARYGADSPEAAAAEPLIRGAIAMAPAIQTPFAGVNPAFALETAIAAHRDPETLAWTDTPVFTLDGPPPASDVPAWWLLQKKNALYYNGMGRGDFARLLSQTSIVCIEGTDHADDIDADFPDVLAWVRQLQPPPWPGDLDAQRAAEGAEVFAARCASCHGTYSDDPAAETYPNLLVHVDEVGTDPTYADALDGPLVEWMNASWWTSGEHGGEIVALPGYVAPPLDGVWATAPYLHNGSVPDLASLLDSTTRPDQWGRDFSSSTYDLERVGWPWVSAPADGDPWVYDTTLAGYANTGHTYGDALDAAERAALIEYLKTL